MNDSVQRIDVHGRRLEVQWIAGSDAAAPPLVFLHEGLGSLGLWKGIPRSLVHGTGASALVYSRYGNGFSDVLQAPRAPNYLHEEALEVLPALLEHCGIREPVLIGHSDGASIAIVYAAEHPVRGLVLEAPHVFVEDLSVRSIGAIREPYEHGTLRKRMHRHHADVDRTFYGWNEIWLSPAFADWNIETYASRLVAPILLVQGTDDEYGTPEQLEAIRRASKGPVDELLLSGCGHAPHRDRPELVLPLIGAFVRNVASPASREIA